MSPLRQLTLSCVASAGFILAAAAVAPQGPGIVVTGEAVPHGHEAVHRTVNIGDLNLASATGVHELENRMTTAVNKVCPMASGNVPHHERQDTQACRKKAWASARPQMNRAIADAKAKHGK